VNTPRFLAYISDMRTHRVLFLLLWTVFAIPSAFCSDLALIHAKIYTSPTDPPIEDGTILAHDDRILSVGPTAQIKIPHDATVIDCQGLAVTAGFWNSHVHILTPALLRSSDLSSAELTSQLQEMFTRWGFTTVFDVASVLKNTNLIRRRIQAGEVQGPRILTVGEPFWGKGGTPIYVKAFLEANHVSIPDVESTAQATERVQQQIHDGADGIKIFANSIEPNQILNLPLDLAKAIVTEAHRASKPVFAHVSNDQGSEIALQSGVDILTHTTPSDELWSSSFAQRLVAAHLALTPTLTLWDVEATRAKASPDYIETGMTRAARQLQAFSDAGGQVLFGTDIGYIDQFDTSEELIWMSRAGLTFQQLLASLTTNPAGRFGYSSHSGRLAQGMDADFVVLDSDPARDVTALSKIHQVFRAGHQIYPLH